MLEDKCTDACIWMFKISRILSRKSSLRLCGDASIEHYYRRRRPAMAEYPARCADPVIGSENLYVC